MKKRGDKGMARKTVTIPFDSAYIHEYMSEKGLTLVDASESIGYSRTYISQCLRKNMIRPYVLKGLCDSIGADYERATKVGDTVGFKNVQRNGVYVNSEYIRTLAEKAGVSLTEASIEFGKAEGYYRHRLAEERIDVGALRYLCVLIGADWQKATTPSKKEDAATDEKPPVNVEDITQTIYDVAQIVLDDVKEVGKIGDDIKREVRVTRDAMNEALVKMQMEQHEILTVLRNMQASNRELLTAVHNDLVKAK